MMSSNTEIQVFVSTYNGEKYITEQIDSLLKQRTRQNVEIIIRDDGSSDRTVPILKEMIVNNTSPFKITLEEGSNLGFKRSFYELLKKATAEILFLCDQDDIWHPDKVETLSNRLKKENKKIACVFSSISLIGEGSSDLFSKTGYVHDGKNEKFFFQNFIPGCAIAFTKEVKDIYISLFEKANFELLHDHAIVLIAACANNLFYEQQKLLSYRIHENNTLGLGKKLPVSIKLKELLKYTFNNQAYQRSVLTENGLHLLNLLLAEDKRASFVDERMKNILDLTVHFTGFGYFTRKYYLLKYDFIFRKYFLDKLVILLCV